MIRVEGASGFFTTDTSVRDRLSRRSCFMEVEDPELRGRLTTDLVDSSDRLLAAPRSSAFACLRFLSIADMQAEHSPFYSVSALC